MCVNPSVLYMLFNVHSLTTLITNNQIYTFCIAADKASVESLPYADVLVESARISATEVHR